IDLLDVTIIHMDTIFLGNSLTRWLQASLVFAAILVLFLLTRTVFRKKAKHSPKPNLPTTLLSQLLLPTALIAAIWIASRFLEMSATVGAWVRILLIALLTTEAGRWADLAVDQWTDLQIAKLPDEDYTRRTSLRGITIIARILIWLVVVLVILESIPNFDIASIIASLGLGGIA